MLESCQVLLSSFCESSHEREGEGKWAKFGPEQHQGFLRQNTRERGGVEKGGRQPGSGHIHLFLAVVRNGAQGWPGICQACRTPAPNTLPASRSSLVLLFAPCVFRGGKNYFL